MSNEYIFFTDQTALTFRICLVSRHKVEVSGQLHALCILPMGKEHLGPAG